VLARTLEKAGLSTIFVTNMPFWAEKIGVPRTLAVEFPFGHVLGQPNNLAQQMSVILEALEVLRTADGPGSIVHSQQKWPLPADVTIQSWQPEIPSPIIAHMSKEIRETIRRSRMD
jgi:hypothetical protein